jgi:hypothetical protein
VIIVAGIILAAFLGWSACYAIYVIDWQKRAFVALDIAKLYAMCYFKCGAKADCPDCKGDGFVIDPVFVQPCRTCYDKLSEVWVTDGKLEFPEGKSASPKPLP